MEPTIVVGETEREAAVLRARDLRTARKKMIRDRAAWLAFRKERMAREAGRCVREPTPASPGHHDPVEERAVPPPDQFDHTISLSEQVRRIRTALETIRKQ